MKYEVWIKPDEEWELYGEYNSATAMGYALYDLGIKNPHLTNIIVEEKP